MVGNKGEGLLQACISSSLIKQSVNPQPIDRFNALKTGLLNGEEDFFKK